ncbi:MAG TPA: 7-cyano-7-deazaguanine synthase [Planctomycetes bacterium]|nr:7-cyano-7-deazaguanine synthase [Planctomycetota bacterium]
MGDVLLLSGGLDSTALAFQLKPPHAVVIDYGQVTARGEIVAARAVAEALAIPITVIEVDCRSVGSGLLAHQPTPAHSPSAEWWPFRNQLLASLAGAWAVSSAQKIETLLFGTVATDSFHRDGTKEFFTALNELMRAQEGGVGVAAPAIEKTSAALVREAEIPDSVLAWTHSCHRASVACGDCPGCAKRQEVLLELGRLQ